MPSSFTTLAAVALAASALLAAAPGVVAFTVVQLGDSAASPTYASNYLDKYCGGAVTTVKGVGGTTAQQWATAESGSDLYAPEIVKPDGTCFDVAVLSLGGNDGLNSQCTKDFTADITTVLNQMTAACSSMKIVMLGYCKPTKCFSECPGDIATNGAYLNGHVKTACDGVEACTFIDSTNMCGGTDTAGSSGEFHIDVIHFNEKGYCTLWSDDAIRAAIGCTGEKTTCPSVTGYCVGGSAGGDDDSAAAKTTGNPAVALVLGLVPALLFAAFGDSF